MQQWIIAAMFCGGCWLATATMAEGQMFRADPVQSETATGTFYAPPYARPAVSPYVNLDIDTDGLPAYQTLVRPLLEQRELLERQAATQEQYRRRFPGTTPDQAGGEPQAGGRRSPVRFMHYSHYFGTAR